MLPDAVEIVEVSPRDGLQNEGRPVGTADKLRLIEAVIRAGATRIEATSFVHPARVPQMADAEAVMAGLPRAPGVIVSGLVLNRRGAERAIAAGCDELTFTVVASEAFGQRNQGQTIEQGLTAWAEVAAMARAAGRRATVMIATAFGCPFQGAVDPARVEDMARRVLRSGPEEIGLADTIGVGTPRQVMDLFGRVRAAVASSGMRPALMRAHFHNTRNTGYANAYAALLAGATVLDSSAGGIGGCPFAPRATGNIATEDLLFLLDGLGVRHGIERGAVAALDPWLAEVLGHAVPGQLGKTDAWPPVP
jgi:hydroxymethylglutaryl-CoA lyase